MMEEVIKKSFKGYRYNFVETKPNIFQIVIFGPDKKKLFDFEIFGNKANSIAKIIINECLAASKDGTLSRSQKSRIKTFIAKTLEDHDAVIKPVIEITRAKDIKQGLVLAPRGVDIVTDDDLVIVDLYNNDKTNCLKMFDGVFREILIDTSVLQTDYIIVDSVDNFDSYKNYKKQVETMESYFARCIKKISNDINNTANYNYDDSIGSYIKDAILSSEYDGITKERMIVALEKIIK